MLGVRDGHHREPVARRRAAAPVVAILLLAAGCAAATDSDPDVVLVTVDTLRADRLGAYGHEQARTPVTDALARRGRVFTAAITPMPRTTPALASLLTGLWPQHHGSREVDQPMNDARSLVELLRDRGYWTIGVSANDTAGTVHGLGRGFERFVDAEQLPARDAAATTLRAAALVDEAPQDRPLFLWVHYMDPHAPYAPPAAFDPGPAGNACREMVRVMTERGWPAGHLFDDREGLASGALGSCSRLYDGEIAFTDEQIGMLFARLDARRSTGRRRISVLTSDHGENLGEDGLYYEHGPSLHEASLRVPLILVAPGIAPGPDDAPIGLEDVPATLLGLLGVAPAERPPMDGEDLSARISGGTGGDRSDAVRMAESGSALHVHNFGFLHSGRAHHLHCLNGERFSLCSRPGEQPQLFDHVEDPDLRQAVGERHGDALELFLGARRIWRPERARRRAARGSRFKLVELPQLSGGYRTALYDLERDPGEVEDVASRHPDETRRLALALERWAADLGEEPASPRSDEQLERLRSLGYVQ